VAAFAHAHALLIGIAAYAHLPRLPAVRDTADLHALLTDPARGGYPPGQVRVLTEEAATVDAIRQALRDLAAACDPASTAFLYFSGHGGRITSGPRRGEYLLPFEAEYPTEAGTGPAISGEELTEALRAVPARRVVVVFDCCHAGGIGQPKGGAIPALTPGLSESYYAGLAATRGRVILASSRDGEFSYVPAGSDYGLFTQHLLAGLQGGAAGADGQVRIFDLFEYLQPRVTATQPHQHPLFKGELEENFAVALHQAGPPGVAPLAADGYRYDVYISYVDREPDSAWVWDTLVPRLEAAGLRMAVAHDLEEPGVARVFSVERGITQARRVIAVLSDAYLADHDAEFATILGQTAGITGGTYRLLPVQIAPLGTPPSLRLSALVTLDFTHPGRADRTFARLVQALHSPLPRMDSALRQPPPPGSAGP
jgi:hypothetical protein